MCLRLFVLLRANWIRSQTAGDGYRSGYGCNSGHRLLAPEAEETLKTVLLPKASIVTPNIPEAEVLAGMKIESFTDMEESARRIAALGPQAVLVKGGHRVGDATDILYAHQEFTYFKGEHLDSTSTHGTGCSLSSAIAADLANGLSLIDAVREAKTLCL